LSSVILDLQKEALDKDISVNDLLRKAYVVARKLKIDEFEKMDTTRTEWLQRT